jgi:hypothetical protein
MRLCWLLASPLERINGTLTSNFASVRYRAVPAMRAMLQGGHQVSALQQPALKSMADLKAHWAPCDLLVVSKVDYNSVPQIAAFARSRGARMVVDACDDHFETPQFCDAFHQTLHMADYVTCSTDTLASRIRERTGRQATVILDPFEAPASPPRFQPGAERLRLLWFGSATNFGTLAAALPDLVEFGRHRPLSLRVVTALDDPDVTRIAHLVNSQHASELTFEPHQWSLHDQWSHFDACDLVIIPSRNVQDKLVKSPNRLVESLRRGRFVVAYPIPSYRPLADFSWQGEHLAQGIAWALAHPAEVRERIADGQRYVEGHYHPAAIAARWSDCLNAAFKGHLKLAQ